MNVCPECSPDCNGYTDLTNAAIIIIIIIILILPVSNRGHLLLFQISCGGKLSVGPVLFSRYFGSKLWSDQCSYFQGIKEHLQSDQRTMSSGKRIIDYISTLQWTSLSCCLQLLILWNAWSHFCKHSCVSSFSYLLLNQFWSLSHCFYAFCERLCNNCSQHNAHSSIL